MNVISKQSSQHDEIVFLSPHRAPDRHQGSDCQLQRTSPTHSDTAPRAFKLREIELSAVESPPGELPRLGQAPPAEAAKRREDAGDNRGPAVQVQLAAVLAREAARSREPQEEAPVEGVLGARRVVGKEGTETGAFGQLMCFRICH